MTCRFSFHSNVIGISVFSILVATIYSVFVPQAGRKTPDEFVLPDEISLPDWKLVNSNPNEIKILSQKKSHREIKAKKEYVLTHENKTLAIKAYYLVNTRGNLKSLLKQHFQIDQQTLGNMQIKQLNQNYYSIFTSQDHTYLSSCLNSFGRSTFTQEQFSQHLNNRLLNLKLIGKWLLGDGSIRDRRCLWTTISIPNYQGTSKELIQTLEQIWDDYRHWWQKRFPDL